MQFLFFILPCLQILFFHPSDISAQAESSDGGCCRLYVIEKPGVAGYVDQDGQMVLETEYGWTGEFSEGLGLVSGQNGYGFIDLAGNTVIDTKYVMPNITRIHPGCGEDPEYCGFREGLAAVGFREDENQPYHYGYITHTGDWAIQPIYDWAQPLHDGLGLVKQTEDDQTKFAFLNREGHVVFESNYEIVESFNEGRALFLAENARFGFYNTQGNIVIEPQFPYADSFSDNLALVRDASEKYGYIDQDGNIVIPCQFDFAGPFTEGLAGAGFLPPGIESTDGFTFQNLDLLRLGYIDKTGAWAIEPRFAEVGPFSGGYAKVYATNLSYIYVKSYYFIDRTGEVALGPIPPEPIGCPICSRDMRSFSGGLVPIGPSKWDEYCLMNVDGRVVTDGFTWIGPFSGGLAPVKTAAKYGYIDSDGNVVIEPRFPEAHRFQEDLACVRVGDRYGFIDETGEFAIEPKFTYAVGFSEGLAPASVESYPVADYMGYIDKTGDFVIEPRFSSCMAFNEGLAIACEFPPAADNYSYIDNNMWYKFGDREDTWSGFIDSEGNRVIEYEDQLFGHIFSEGLLLVHNENLHGYMDRDGNMAIEYRFSGAEDFSEGLAVARDSDTSLYGFIDHSGDWIIAPQYLSARSFSEGLAFITLEDRGGFIDYSGNLVIPSHYWTSQGFVNGLVSARDENGLWGFLDLSGAWAIQPQFGRAGDFNGELAVVSIIGSPNATGIDAYVNRSGEIIWQRSQYR